jgi:hypothetical protein
LKTKIRGSDMGDDILDIIIPTDTEVQKRRQKD